jgi:hypothetical protein
MLTSIENIFIKEDYISENYDENKDIIKNSILKKGLCIENKDEYIKYFKDIFFDYEESIDIRIKAFYIIYEKDILETQEIITDLSSIYYFTPTTLIKEIIIKLCNLSDIDISLRYPLCCSIFNSESKNESYYLFIKLLNDLLFSEKESSNKDLFQFTFFLYILKLVLIKENNFIHLFKHNLSEYKEVDLQEDDIYNILDKLVYKCKELNIINNLYENFYSMYNTNEYYNNYIYYLFHIMIPYSNYKLKLLLYSFFLHLNINDDVPILFKGDISFYTLLINIKEDIKNIILNKELEDNIRADGSDLLLSLEVNEENEKYIKLGKEIINELSYSNKNNFYENKQNVHSIDLDDNIKEFIHYLSNLPSLIVMKNNEDDLFNNIKKELMIHSKEYLNKGNFPQVEKNDFHIEKDIEQSLNRIYLDSRLYQGFTLLTLFIKIWLYINQNEDKNELINRLIEELVDMKDTCSSGHIIRLINVFSGIDKNISLKYNVKELIKSKILFLLNKNINNEEDDYQNVIIDDSIENESKTNEINEYNKYIMKKIIEIKKDIYEEYKDLIKDIDDFEEIFREEMKNIQIS